MSETAAADEEHGGITINAPVLGVVIPVQRVKSIQRLQYNRKDDGQHQRREDGGVEHR